MKTAGKADAPAAAGPSSEPGESASGRAADRSAGSGKRRRDPRPTPAGRQSSSGSSSGGQGKRRRQYQKPTDQELEDGLRKALKVCSAGMRFRCDYCATHMERQAAATARRMIEDQDLRDVAEKIYMWCDQYAGASHLFMFLAVPFVHHLAPGFIYRPAAPVVGALAGAGPMPPRQSANGRHVHHMPPAWPDPTDRPQAAAPVDTRPPTSQEGSAPAPPEPDSSFADMAATMFGGMDLEQLLTAADQAGIRIEGMDLTSLLPADAAPTLDDEDAGSEAPTPADPAKTVIVPPDDSEPDPFAAAATAQTEASVAVSDAD